MCGGRGQSLVYKHDGRCNTARLAGDDWLRVSKRGARCPDTIKIMSSAMCSTYLENVKKCSTLLRALRCNITLPSKI